MKKTLSLLLCAMLLFCSLTSCKKDEISVPELPYEEYAGYKVLNLSCEGDCLCIYYVKNGHQHKKDPITVKEDDVASPVTLQLFGEAWELFYKGTKYLPCGDYRVRKYGIDKGLTPDHPNLHGRISVQFCEDGTLHTLYRCSFDELAMQSDMTDAEAEAALAAALGELFDLSGYTGFDCLWTDPPYHFYRAEFYREENGYKVGDSLIVKGHDDYIESAEKRQAMTVPSDLPLPAPEKVDEIVAAFLEANLLDSTRKYYEMTYEISSEIIRFYDSYGLYVTIFMRLEHREELEYVHVEEIPIFILIEG